MLLLNIVAWFGDDDKWSFYKNFANPLPFTSRRVVLFTPSGGRKGKRKQRQQGQKSLKNMIQLYVKKSINKRKTTPQKTNIPPQKQPPGNKKQPYPQKAYPTRSTTRGTKHTTTHNANTKSK